MRSAAGAPLTSSLCAGLPRLQMARLARLSKLTDRLAGTSSMTSVVSIVKLYLVVVLLAHWIACIWFSIVQVCTARAPWRWRS